MKKPFISRIKQLLSIGVSMTLVLVICSLLSCKAKKLAAEKMPTNRIEFGHGGGFTGAVTTYVLLDNGRIYLDNPDKKEYNPLRKISKNDATELYQECEKVMTLKTDSPGNLYYFVTLKKDSINSKRLIYGDPSIAPPAELEALYKKLVGLVPVK
jgi:hypothetical protein